MKLEVDKLDIGKLETTPVDLSDVVKGEVVKKTGYNEPVKKIDALQTTDTSKFFKRDGYATKINEMENKMLDHGKFVTTKEFNNLTVANFAARLAQEKLATKNDIANFAEKTDFDDTIKILRKDIIKTKQDI